MANWREWSIQFRIENKTGYTLWRRHYNYAFFIDRVDNRGDPYAGYYDPAVAVGANIAAGLDPSDNKRLWEIPPGGVAACVINLAFNRSPPEPNRAPWTQVRGWCAFEPKENPTAGGIRLRWRRDFRPLAESLTFAVDDFGLPDGSLGVLDCSNQQLKNFVSLRPDGSITVPVTPRARIVGGVPRQKVPIEDGSLRVVVSWENANSPLLPDALARVTLTGTGGEVTLRQSAPGRREFSVARGTTSLALSATFSVNFGAVKGKAPGTNTDTNVPSMQHDVLKIEQTYKVVDDSRLDPETISDYQGAHPLTNLSSGGAGIVSISLRTAFVDIGPLWASYAETWAYMSANPPPGTTLAALGYTGGMPIVWMVAFPSTMASYANPNTSCLLFYRPSSYAYTRLDQPHQAEAFYRYLYAPVADSTPNARYLDRDHYVAGEEYFYIRCGFAKALVQSRRAVVLLYPQPSGLNVGAATWSAATLAEGAIRFLWARGLLCKKTANVRLGRFGLAAFSAGGGSLWMALNAARGRVSEVYAFEPNEMNGAIDSLVRWYKAQEDRCLRVVGGEKGHLTVRTIHQRLGESPRLSTIHESPEEFAEGYNPAWDHALHECPHLRSYGDAQHQFTVYGGPRYTAGATETYLRTFLDGSSFNRL